MFGQPWFLLVILFACIRHYSPRHGRRYGRRLVIPPHGPLTPAGNSRSGSPMENRSIIIPVGVVAIQPTTGCFTGRWDRWAPFLPSLIKALRTRSGLLQVVLAHPADVACSVLQSPFRNVSISPGINLSRSSEVKNVPSLYYPKKSRKINLFPEKNF